MCNKDDELAWVEISTEHIVRDQWIDFRKSAFRYPDGRVFEPFYSYTRKDYAVIVASDEEGKFLCVRQFRQGIREVTTEFPAGGIEYADGKAHGSPDHVEDALAAAKRELLEETGYASDDWEHLLTIPANATISDNYAFLFRAKNCRFAGDQNLDEMEVLKVCRYSAEEIDKMICDGRFQQSDHVLAWLLATLKKQT